MISTRLLSLARDPLFWIGTVFCGLVVSTLANYFTRMTDRFITAFSSRRQKRLAAQNSSLREEAARLLEHPGERFDLKLDVLYYGGRMLLFGIYGCTFVALSALAELRISNDILRAVLIGVLLLSALFAILQLARYRFKEQRALEILWQYEDLKNLSNRELTEARRQNG
jgi:multisubunit Na+/H+ antiporter MnhB subunit